MYIEQLNEQHTIAMRIDTCLATLTQDIAEPVQAFYAELAANGVTPKDPLVFVYRDLDGDIHRPFSLEVAQPIDEDTRAHYRGKHALGTLKPMSCVQRVHQGTLADMGERTMSTSTRSAVACGGGRLGVPDARLSDNSVLSAPSHTRGHSHDSAHHCRRAERDAALRERPGGRRIFPI